jgi:hypothetical protein
LLVKLKKKQETRAASWKRCKSIGEQELSQIKVSQILSATQKFCGKSPTNNTLASESILEI